MKALSFDVPKRKGRPTLKLIDAPKPTPAKGEVLVRITHAGLNHGDFETWTGRQNKALKKRLKSSPVLTGIEMAGIAESDGRAIRKGDQVYGYTNIFKGPWFHAEFVALKETNMARVPRGMTLEGAAALVGGAVTSIAALERIAKTKTGDRLLVTGATGSVGVTALQLAKHLGAQVTAICHSSQRDFALSLGASTVLAYGTREQLPEENQFDTIFDAAPSLTFSKALPLLKPKGTYITTMPHLDMAGFLRALASSRKWGFLLESDTDPKRLARLSALMEEGVFTPIVDRSHTLQDAADAFARQEESGKRGKIILEMLTTQ